jgi:hypothetical protein
MQPTETLNNWVFVTHTPLHLVRLKAGNESWWCVDRRCKAGEQAFIYKPLTGIILHLKILELSKTPELFCDTYQMATAKIKVLNVFDPPITSKQLKSSKIVRSEQFVRRNFQGKSFLLLSPPTAIIALGAPDKPQAPKPHKLSPT